MAAPAVAIGAAIWGAVWLLPLLLLLLPVAVTRQGHDTAVYGRVMAVNGTLIGLLRAVGANTNGTRP